MREAITLSIALSLSLSLALPPSLSLCHAPVSTWPTSCCIISLAVKISSSVRICTIHFIKFAKCKAKQKYFSCFVCSLPLPVNCFILLLLFLLLLPIEMHLAQTTKCAA